MTQPFTRGKAEGRVEGKTIWTAEGEKRKAIETALKMQAKGFYSQTIRGLIGLPLDEITKL